MDNDLPRIQYCHVQQCKICKNKQLDTNTTFHSNLNQKSFNIEFSQNCKTNMVVYLISCKHENCTLKNVGRTNQAINRRLALHRANIVAGTEGPAMMHHFTKVHQPSDMMIKAIEVCSKATIKERERFWITELNTAFPYGLNDRIDAPPIQDAYSYTLLNTATNHAIYETFNKVSSRRTKRGGSHRSRRQKTINMFDPIAFMDTITTTNMHRKELFTNHVRTQIMNLNKDSNKKLFLHLCTCINEHNANFHNYNSNQYTSYLTYLCRDITFAKLKSMYVQRKKQSPARHFMVVDFCNKLMDNINFNKIIKHKDIVNLFPAVDDVTLKSPTISFKYTPTIKAKINNYRQVISQGITPTQCDCQNYDEQYKVDHHVFTGNLNIIQNTELRSTMMKGLNFREIPPANKDSVMKSVTDSMNLYIEHTSGISKQPIVSFTPWKSEFLRRIQLQLDKLNCYHYNNVLAKPTNITDLNNLKNKWVFTTTDKASNNITVVCKKYYMETLDREIYTSGNFVKSNQTINDILDNQTKFLAKFNLDTDKKMPFLYWTAKLHKNPYAHRFITSGRGCATQPLSIQVGYCLKTVLNIVRNNAKFHRKKTNVNNCFVIDNRDPVTAFINNCNKSNNVHSVSTYDFKTLYTSIPHNKLKQSLSSTIRSAFTSRKKKFISVSRGKATLCDERKSACSLSVQQLIKCVNFLIDNSFISYKGEVYRQCIGIPMGTNCAPYVANLFLHTYESNYIDRLITNNRTDLAISLANMYRYQDDCIIFNDYGIFGNNWKEVYPEEMHLEKTNTGNTCTFLDLAISIQDGKFLYQSYDKRKDFNFDIINYPHLNSNVPQIPSYGVFTSQLIRFCEVNSQLLHFKNDIQLLVQKLVKQKFDPAILKAKFTQFYGNNIIRWSKFGTDIYNLLQIF